MKISEKKCAIFIDIDGTLMGTRDDALKRNIDVIQKVRSLGHKVLISTGRATHYLPSHIDFSKCFDGVISGAGARIILDGEEIFCKKVPFETVRRFYDFGKDKDKAYILEGIDDTIFLGLRPDDDWTFVDEHNEKEIIKEDLRIEKFTIIGAVPEQLKCLLGDSMVAIEHKEYSEIIQKDCTKASAMMFVVDKLGIDKAHSIAMGDSLNDFDMITAAGFGVAMGNAVPEIKEISDLVTLDVNDAGVAKALEDIFNL